MNNNFALLSLFRPKQWVKNIFVFLPLFFDKHLFEAAYFPYTLITFISFCAIASSIYCLNDLKDLSSDRNHPIKCKRPLASGAVTELSAKVSFVVLAIMSFAILVFLPEVRFLQVSLCVLVYFILNILYCIVLKQISILDVFIIAFGYVLRVLAGAAAISVIPSSWIILMTFLITLFIAFAKRRDDVFAFEKNGDIRRKSITKYNLSFLDNILTLLAATSIICYIMYCISPEVEERFSSNQIYLTSVLVIAGIIRYLQATLVEKKSGSPTELILKDPFILGCLILWFISFIIIIYLP